MAEGDDAVRARIEKDISKFHESVKEASPITDKRIVHVIELSMMYASDAKSYLGKGDLPTAFSCISYAHGLLDAAKSINNNEV